MPGKARPKMTLEELKTWPEETISPLQASGVLHCSPYVLNKMAREGKLQIRHIFMGERLRISKAALLEFCGVNAP